MDRLAGADLAAELLDAIRHRPRRATVQALMPEMIRCALLFLGEDRAGDAALATTITGMVGGHHDDRNHPEPGRAPLDQVTAAEVLIRMTDLELPVPDLLLYSFSTGGYLDELQRQRPDLGRAVRAIVHPGRGA